MREVYVETRQTFGEAGADLPWPTDAAGRVTARSTPYQRYLRARAAMERALGQHLVQHIESTARLPAPADGGDLSVADACALIHRSGYSRRRRSEACSIILAYTRTEAYLAVTMKAAR